MQLIKCPTCLFIWIVLVVSTRVWGQIDRSDQWDHDLAVVQQDLPRLHKDLFFHKDSTWFYAQMNELRRQVHSLSDEDIVIRLQEIVAAMGDSHTWVNGTAVIHHKATLPLECFWFKEGLFVLVGERHCQALVGKRLLEINGHPVRTILDSLEQVVALDNEAMKWDRLPRLIRQVPLLRHYGFVQGDTIPVTVQNDEGAPETVHVVSQSVRLESDHRVSVRYQPGSWPQGWKHPDSWFWEEWLPADSIYFVQYNRCWSKEVQRKQGKRKYATSMPAFKPFGDQVIHTLKTRPVKALVLDLRFNGGGSSRQGTRLIRQIAALRPDQQPEKIYVLQGRRTFSSAVINLLDTKKHLAAIAVGEMTGGKANHFGEVKSFSTPHWKLQILYSSRYFRFNALNEDSIQPDLHVMPTFADYAAGRDSALDRIREALRDADLNSE